MRNVYKILVGIPEGKRPLRKPRPRWEGNTRKDLREMEWEGLDSIHLAQVKDQWWALGTFGFSKRCGIS
jgi:hypothetical protein